MEYFPHSVHYLIPDDPSPCDLFLQFRGKFVTGNQKGLPVSVEFLEKLAKAKFSCVYIRGEDAKVWQEWVDTRHPKVKVGKCEPTNEAALKKYGNKRFEYLGTMQKAIVPRVADDAEVTPACKNSLLAIQKVLRSSSLDWYFHQFHEPPDLFYHSARVTFLSTIFSLLHSPLDGPRLENFIYSMVIHELEGDPAKNLKTVVSEKTIEILEKQRCPVPEEVIEYIRNQDELASGSGFPKQKRGNEVLLEQRIFSFFNHLDHNRLVFTGTRRARLDATRKKMEAAKIDYDSALWNKFWDFLEKEIEVVT